MYLIDWVLSGPGLGAEQLCRTCGSAARIGHWAVGRVSVSVAIGQSPPLSPSSSPERGQSHMCQPLICA